MTDDFIPWGLHWLLQETDWYFCLLSWGLEDGVGGDDEGEEGDDDLENLSAVRDCCFLNCFHWELGGEWGDIFRPQLQLNRHSCREEQCLQIEVSVVKQGEGAEKEIMSKERNCPLVYGEKWVPLVGDLFWRSPMQTLSTCGWKF